jgi:hypothetical protein
MFRGSGMSDLISIHENLIRGENAVTGIYVAP